MKKPKKQSEAGALAFQARLAMMKLRTLARTDTEAASLLSSELTNAVRKLNTDAFHNPGHYRTVAGKACKWPGVISSDRDIQHAQAKLANALGLGRDAVVNYPQGKRQWSRQTPEILAALELIPILMHRGLPPLTKATASQWWKEARPLFVDYFGEDFENHPLFKARSTQGQTALTPDERRQADRKLILTAMPQAFKSLAHK